MSLANLFRRRTFSNPLQEIQIMARPRLVIRPVEKTVSIPTDVVARIDLELFSEIEGRVPHGKWAELVTTLLRRHIQNLDATQATHAEIPGVEK